MKMLVILIFISHILLSQEVNQAGLHIELEIVLSCKTGKRLISILKDQVYKMNAQRKRK